MQIRKEHRVTYKEVSRYPAVRRDLSLLVSDGTSFDRLKQLASHAETRILKEVSIFDKYTPKNDQQGRLPDGKKSYALSFVLRDDEKTLTDKQVDQVMQRLIKIGRASCRERVCQYV